MAVQKRTEPDWQDIRVFLALGRHGSLSAAARALSVNHATIARRLHALETALGEKLVERRPDGYVLTLPARAPWRQPATWKRRSRRWGGAMATTARVARCA